MSVSPASAIRSPYAEPLRGPVSGLRASGSRWARLAVIVAILGASGGTRLWQEFQVVRALKQGRTSSFPLAALPMTLGPWEGRPTTIDPEIVRIAGTTDLVTRRYIDRRTGVGLDVIIAYGPTSDMFFHTPDNCYPAAGFDILPGDFERPIALGAGRAVVPFRSLAFLKGEGGLAEMQEVYYSLRYDGRWTTRSASPKASKRSPGMYRVQVARRLTGRERRDVDNPCEPFLASLVGEIEARIDGKPPVTTTSYY